LLDKCFTRITSENAQAIEEPRHSEDGDNVEVSVMMLCLIDKLQLYVREER